MLRNRSKVGRTRSGNEMLRDIETSMKERILQLRASLIKMTMLWNNLCHMAEKGKHVQAIRLENEGLTKARSDATIVKAGVILIMNVEVQMQERRRRNTSEMRLTWHKQNKQNRKVIVIQRWKQLC